MGRDTGVVWMWETVLETVLETWEAVASTEGSTEGRPASALVGGVRVPSDTAPIAADSSSSAALGVVSKRYCTAAHFQLQNSSSERPAPVMFKLGQSAPHALKMLVV